MTDKLCHLLSIHVSFTFQFFFPIFFNRGWERQGPRAMGALENEMALIILKFTTDVKEMAPSKFLRWLKYLKMARFTHCPSQSLRLWIIEIFSGKTYMLKSHSTCLNKCMFIFLQMTTTLAFTHITVKNVYGVFRAVVCVR